MIAVQPGNGPYLLGQGSALVEENVVGALIAQLNARGVEVHIPDRLRARLGWHRHVTGNEIGTIVLNTGPRGPRRAGRRAARGLRPGSPPGRRAGRAGTGVLIGSPAACLRVTPG